MQRDCRSAVSSSRGPGARNAILIAWKVRSQLLSCHLRPPRACSSRKPGLEVQLELEPHPSVCTVGIPGSVPVATLASAGVQASTCEQQIATMLTAALPSYSSTELPQPRNPAALFL